MAASTSKLFQPLQVGKSALKNRIVMAPLTRFRASDSHAPIVPLVAEYYSQRAAVPGTLLISEATFIAPQAAGYDNAPGIWSSEQIAAWKQVTDAVHAKGGYMFLQLWALGRAADPTSLAKEGKGYKVKSSSTVPFEGGATPEALTEEEIQEYIQEYASAGKRAIEAGFDGVEIHGANGYLIDQFTQDTANQRTDKWGGSIENRTRFAIEVSKAVVAAVGADRTAIRLSPFSPFQGMKMADPYPTFNYLVAELKKLKLAYLHLVESRIAGNADVEATEKVDPLISIWDNVSPILLAGGFRPDSAIYTVDEQYKDNDIAIVFGRFFISNPDLVFRVKENIEFTPYSRDLFYNKGEAKGYTSWENSKEFESAKLVDAARS